MDWAKVKRERVGRIWQDVCRTSSSVMWHFRNDEPFSSPTDKFNQVFFNMKNKDPIIETYLNCLEEILFDIQIPTNSYNSLTKKTGCFT